MMGRSLPCPVLTHARGTLVDAKDTCRYSTAWKSKASDPILWSGLDRVRFRKSINEEGLRKKEGFKTKTR